MIFKNIFFNDAGNGILRKRFHIKANVIKYDDLTSLQYLTTYYVSAVFKCSERIPPPLENFSPGTFEGF